MDKHKIAILLLAAGNSSRMGKPKQLLPVGNSNLLRIAIEHALASKADTIFCVLGANSDEIKKSISKYNIEILFNANWQEGLSSSIAEGIKTIEKSKTAFGGTLIILADQPFVDSDYLNKMIDHFQTNKNAIIASRYDGFYGVPALFPKKFFKQLLELKGDSGAKKLLNDASYNIIPVPSEEKLTDIDTLDEYQNLVENWSV